MMNLLTILSSTRVLLIRYCTAVPRIINVSAERIVFVFGKSIFAYDFCWKENKVI